MVSPAATSSYQASIIASSAAAAVGNGLPKTVRECSWPRCRSDQIQVRRVGFGVRDRADRAGLPDQRLGVPLVHHRAYGWRERLPQLVDVERLQTLCVWERP